MKILIINGPNLNLLGKREPEVYGKLSFENYFEELKNRFPTVELEYFQSNHEGLIIDKIHEIGFTFDGLIINAGGYTHSSVAIRDAISSITTPAIEVHISNIHAREEFRKQSFLTPVCRGLITGLGLKGYLLALRSFVD